MVSGGLYTLVLPLWVGVGSRLARVGSPGVRVRVLGCGAPPCVCVLFLRGSENGAVMWKLERPFSFFRESVLSESDAEKHGP